MSGAFDKLARPIQKWVRTRGWSDLRPIQIRAIDEITGGDYDVILAAQTAAGKTEAIFLPLISQALRQPAAPGFDLLYIAPLKALITDQADRLEDICREAELPVTPWHGDVAQSIKTRALKAPAGLLLITPESLESLFIRRGLEIPRLFAATRAVVIDELHNFLGSERGMQTRSLLTRLERAVGRKIRRIGLSATLGDMDLARTYLRQDDAASVRLIDGAGTEAETELRMQVRGYVAHPDQDEDGNDTTTPATAIATHLFQHLRGSNNLVFAGTRNRVEFYADRLRRLCEQSRLPLEFHPHHANLSRHQRDGVERRLKGKGTPTTAICTSTLELGIDIGAVKCVAQIGPPFTVATLRQRLGRSGRRPGEPKILRQYAVEAALTPDSCVSEQLRLKLVRTVAMISLLLDGWCEPPRSQGLHLSTLVHQILAVIAQLGGAGARTIHHTLCEAGPFRRVSPGRFATVLRAMGEKRLVEQAEDGLLLLGPVGETLTDHYGFYAVFPTPEEYSLIAEGRQIGTLPVDSVLLSKGMTLIFSGQRWIILDVHDGDKVIIIGRDRSGTPPVFGGTDPGDIHDKVVERMAEILEGEDLPAYLDETAMVLLGDARRHYTRLGFAADPVLPLGDHAFVLATRAGTVKTVTLALALRAFDFTVETHDGFLAVTASRRSPPLSDVLCQLADGAAVDLFGHRANLHFEKFHRYLTRALLEADALSSRLDPDALPMICDRLVRRRADPD